MPANPKAPPSIEVGVSQAERPCAVNGLRVGFRSTTTACVCLFVCVCVCIYVCVHVCVCVATARPDPQDGEAGSPVTDVTRKELAALLRTHYKGNAVARSKQADLDLKWWAATRQPHRSADGAQQ